MPRKRKQIAAKNNLLAPKWFIIISIIISALSLLLNFILTDFSPSPFIVTLDLVILAWLGVNIVMLTKFIKNNYEKGAIWLSGLYIFDFAFSFIVAVFTGIYAGANGIPPESMIISPTVKILTSIFPLVTLFLAVRLLFKR